MVASLLVEPHLALSVTARRLVLWLRGVRDVLAAEGKYLDPKARGFSSGCWACLGCVLV